MSRRKPVDIAETLFRPVRRLEHWRRTVEYLRAYRETLIAAGSSKGEIATLDATIDELADIVARADRFPPDTPAPEPETPVEQPLCHAGDEEWMTPFIAELAA